jgi:hypothetical protein|tara:strand:- start:452 stop:772 length:321 start_codon:yes stop_codon:yes gene_type:complete
MQKISHTEINPKTNLKVFMLFKDFFFKTKKMHGSIIAKIIATHIVKALKKSQTFHNKSVVVQKFKEDSKLNGSLKRRKFIKAKISIPGPASAKLLNELIEPTWTIE